MVMVQETMLSFPAQDLAVGGVVYGADLNAGCDFRILL